MKIIKNGKKICLSCMEEHEVQTIALMDTEVFKDKEITFEATYEYCDRADEYFETEDMIKINSLAMKDAYRKKIGLLTSKEIIAIREKYGVSQKDFSEILDWGGATITRYENHQVQDRAHDDVMRKIDLDPMWFIQMLKRVKGKIPPKAFDMYYLRACANFGKMKNLYLVNSIQALYTNYSDNAITGGVELNLNKVVEAINYYALNVSYLHKVKLMKMLWFADSLSYKRNGKAITGLVYRVRQMGAVPEGSEQIIDLDGIEFETIYYEPDRLGYKFKPAAGFEIKELSKEDIEILDVVIAAVGHLNSQEIVDKMHEEDAYKYTENHSIITYHFAERLSLN